MGANSSKPSSSGAPYEWKGSAPIGASQDLVDTIQSSKETDASRAKLMELHIEARVAQRLKEMQEAGAVALREAREKLSAAEDSPAPAPGADDKTTTKTAGQTQAALTTHQVSKEVEALRARLESRKKVKELPEGVDKAREGVIRCLRDNDRRPLNCYEEIESFKEEVRKLEKGWVDKAIA